MICVASLEVIIFLGKIFFGHLCIHLLIYEYAVHLGLPKLYMYLFTNNCASQQIQLLNVNTCFLVYASIASLPLKLDYLAAVIFICLDARFNSICFKCVPFLNMCVSYHSMYVYWSTAPQNNSVSR